MAVSAEILVSKQVAKGEKSLGMFDKRADHLKPLILRQLLHLFLFFSAI